MFENLKNYAQGHKAGLVTDGSIFPDESVQDCNNVDFLNNEDRRRPPYSKNSVSGSTNIATILEDYSILGIYEKSFFDYTGIKKDVLIVVAKYQNDTVSNITAIFLGDYTVITLDTADHNLKIGDSVLVGSVAGTTQLNNNIYPIIRIDGAIIYVDVDSNAFGVYSSGGTVTPQTHIRVYANYDYNPTTDFGNSHNGSEGWIAQWTDLTEVYLYHDISIGAEWNYDSTVSASPLIYKYTYHDLYPGSIFKDKATGYFNGWFVYDGSSGICIGQIISFINLGSNNYEMTMGVNSKISGGAIAAAVGTLDLTHFYLTKMPWGKHSFNQRYNLTEEGLFDDITECDFEDTYNSVKISIGNGFRPIRVSFLQHKTFWTTAQVDTFKRSWDGLWIGFDVPKVENISSVVEYSAGTPGVQFYDESVIGAELGIRIRAEWIRANSYNNADDEYWKDLVEGLCITLDGFQTIFLKYFVGFNRLQAGNYEVWYSNMQYHLLVDFDRRITDVSFFASAPIRDLQFDAGYKKNLLSYQLTTDRGGILTTTQFERVGTFNYYYAGLILHIFAGAGNNNVIDLAVGLPLNSVINQKYYHTPISAFRLLFKVGENIVGADIGNNFLETKSTVKDNYGYSKIIISNVQFRGDKSVNADSCFSEERIRHLIQGERITNGTGTVGGRFLLFTDKNLFYYNIDDNVSGKIGENFEYYLFKGTYGLRTMIKAQVGDQFAGVYWLANDTIYRFLDRQPEDILYGKWKDQYNEFSESDKQNAVVGFNPFAKDVICKIGSKLFLWNIATESWKNYTFPDTPEIFITSNSGQLIFSSGKNIFKLENYGTVLFKDESAAGFVGIPFKWVKQINHGSNITNKIIDRINLEYEMQINANGVEVNLDVKVGSNGGTNNLFNKTVNLNDKSRYHALIPSRVPVNEARIEINCNDDEANVTKFILKEFLILSKNTQRRLSNGA